MTALLDVDRCALIYGEAMATMRSLLAPKSVDLIVTDPPYSKQTHERFSHEQRYDGAKKREPLLFPHLDDDQIIAYAAEYARVCRGWLITFTDYYATVKWGEAIERAGGRWVRTGYWIKTNPMPQLSGDRPGVAGEEIVIGHFGEGRMKWNGGGRAACWRGPVERGDDRFHPTQKPAWLIQELLGWFCQPGDLVLDPFIGSGTTAVAAIAAERFAGSTPLETTCPKCIAKHAGELAPLPVGVKVIGVEGDIRFALPAAQRILRACGALAA